MDDLLTLALIPRGEASQRTFNNMINTPGATVNGNHQSFTVAPLPTGGFTLSSFSGSANVNGPFNLVHEQNTQLVGQLAANRGGHGGYNRARSHRDTYGRGDFRLDGSTYGASGPGSGAATPSGPLRTQGNNTASVQADIAPSSRHDNGGTPAVTSQGGRGSTRGQRGRQGRGNRSNGAGNRGGNHRVQGQSATTQRRGLNGGSRDPNPIVAVSAFGNQVPPPVPASVADSVVSGHTWSTTTGDSVPGNWTRRSSIAESITGPTSRAHQPHRGRRSSVQSVNNGPRPSSKPPAGGVAARIASMKAHVDVKARAAKLDTAPQHTKAALPSHSVASLAAPPQRNLRGQILP